MKRAAFVSLLILMSLALGASASYYLHEDINSFLSEDISFVEKKFDDLIFVNLDPDPEEEAILYYAVPAFSSNQIILLEKVIEVYDNKDGDWTKVLQLREGFEKNDDGKGGNRVENPIDSFSVVDINNDGLQELLVMQNHESEASLELNEQTGYTLTNSDYTLVGYQDNQIKPLNILSGRQHIPLGLYGEREDLQVRDGKLVEYWSATCEGVAITCYTFEYEIYKDNSDSWVVDFVGFIQREGWDEYKKLFPEATWSDKPYHLSEYLQ